MQITGCDLDSCALKEPGCASPLASQTNVVLGAAPYPVAAIETNSVGYSLTFCYECSVTPTAGGPSFTFTKDGITV